MKWREEIRLQIPENQKSTIVSRLQNLLSQIQPVKGLMAIRLLENQRVNTELSLVIEWSSLATQNKSVLGEELAQLARELGLSHHSTWKDVSVSAADAEKGDQL